MDDLAKLPETALAATLLHKLLGPTADYYGERLKGAAARLPHNLMEIARIACEKLKGALDAPGVVNARVIKHICDEGRFIEDKVAAEYFGGVLAGARSLDPADDTMVPVIDLIKGLSSKQLRLHFIIYTCVARYPRKKEAQDDVRFWRGLRLFIPAAELHALLGEDPQLDLTLFNGITGLIEKGLLGSAFGINMGVRGRWQGSVPVDKPGIFVCPNPKGADLYLKALGCKSLPFDMIVNIDIRPRLSHSLWTELPAPNEYLIDHTAVPDPIGELESELESKVEDLELEIEELRSELEALTVEDVVPKNT